MTHCRFRSLRAPSPLASLIALQFLVAGPLFTEEPASQRSVSQPSSIETVVDDGPLPNERDDLQWLEAMHSPEVLAWARERDTREAHVLPPRRLRCLQQHWLPRSNRDFRADAHRRAGTT